MLPRPPLQAAGLWRFHGTFMAFIIENWILILAALVSGGMLLWPVVKPGAGGAAITTTEAVRLINREKGVLVDVSEPAEFAAGHAGGARNVPLGQITAEGAKGLPTNKTIPVVLLCPTGTRSAKAATLLRKAGHAGAVAVAGGTAAWREASLPIEKTA
jgi:rhodanese-related sulfurtransferase